MEKQCFDWGKFVQTVNEMSKCRSEVLDAAHKWLMERCPEILKKRDETIAYVLESSVRKNAVPQIKGEITKGEIKWRGIQMYMESNGNIFFNQRDRIISPKIRYDGTFADDDSIGLSVFPLNNWTKAEELIKEYEKIMIDPKELRIGNYISYYIYDQQNPHPDRIKSIYFDDESKEYHLEMESGNFSLDHLTIQEIKPIPLTEDILLKCGFDANYESGFVAYKMDAKDAYGHAFDISLIEDNTNSTFNYVCWDINCGMKYVHELMNFYFAITGKELEVKL